MIAARILLWLFCAAFLLWTVVFASLVVMGQGRSPLCINGHPAPRPHHVTYGGLPPRAGFERDHRLPLGLGGPDIRANVWYQQCSRFAEPFGCVEGDAAVKDELERKTEHDLCGGRITLDAARAMPEWQPRYWRGDTR